MPEYCERSYFEALVNALVHRDYLVNGSEVHIDMFDDRMVIYSPGGMPDGTLVQERIIDAIPSTRRNPVLADIFQRLGYMERKGSGLNKIIRAYQNAYNFTEDKLPQFLSSRVEFTVTMKNLNYEAEEVEKTKEKILELMKQEPSITVKEMAEELHISISGVEYNLKRLRDKGAVERVGAAKGGSWKVND